jgi:hypothetical protein
LTRWQLNPGDVFHYNATLNYFILRVGSNIQNKHIIKNHKVNLCFKVTNPRLQFTMKHTSTGKKHLKFKSFLHIKIWVYLFKTVANFEIKIKFLKCMTTIRQNLSLVMFRQILFQFPFWLNSEFTGTQKSCRLHFLLS